MQVTSVIKSPSVNIFRLRNVLSPLTGTGKPGLVMLAWKVEEREPHGNTEAASSSPAIHAQGPGPEPMRLCRGWPATVPGPPRKWSLAPTVNPIRPASLTACPRCGPGSRRTGQVSLCPGGMTRDSTGPSKPSDAVLERSRGWWGPSHSEDHHPSAHLTSQPTCSPAGSGSPDNPPIPPPAWNLPEPRGPPPPIPHATASQPAAHVSPARHHSPVAGSLVWSLTASPPCRKMSSKFSHLCSRLTPPHPGPGPSSELSEPLSGG